MHTNDKKTNIIRILSICIFAASVVLYMLIVNNFIANFTQLDVHRYVFVGLSILYFAAFLIPIERMNGYIHPIRSKNKVWNTIWNALYFFGMVVAATLMEEILWNDKAFFLQPKIYLLNSLVVMVVALVFVMWIPKIWIAYMMTYVVTFIYGLVNHFVYDFKGCPPMFNDFFAAKTAKTVMGGYTYSIDRRIVYGGGTCNSEFEFLTGDSIANIQASAYPYENYDLTETENIVKYLRDAEGYYIIQ